MIEGNGGSAKGLAGSGGAGDFSDETDECKILNGFFLKFNSRERMRDHRFSA